MLARTLQCLLLLGTRVVQQANRNATGLLIVFMTRDQPIDMSQKGLLLSAVAAGYFFTQVPGGALADRIGAKVVVTCVLTLSSLCCVLTPLCFDRFGVPGLWAVTATMGAVQGPLFPAGTVLLSRWMPRDEKAWGSSMLDIGISCGTLFVIPVANSLAETLGWRNAYRLIGLLSFAFALLWWALAAERPSEARRISDEELKYLAEAVAKPPSATSASAAPMPTHLLLHPAVLAIFFAHGAFNFGAYFLSSWNPTYYSEVLSMNPQAARIHLAAPVLADLLMKVLSPSLTRRVEKRGLSVLGTRKAFTAVGFGGAAMAFLPVYGMRHSSPWFSTVMLSLANALIGLAPVGFRSNYLDITDKYVGTISGYGNTFGSAASWVGPQLVAFILDGVGTWQLVHAVVAAFCILASLNFVANASTTPVENSQQDQKRWPFWLGSGGAKKNM